MSRIPEPGEQFAAVATVKAAGEWGVAYHLAGDNIPYACTLDHFHEQFASKAPS